MRYLANLFSNRHAQINSARFAHHPKHFVQNIQIRSSSVRAEGNDVPPTQGSNASLMHRFSYILGYSWTN